MSLLDKASLVVTPNAYKESKLYSVVPNTTLGDMNVVRATTATRVNSAGLIEVVPRNLLTYSQDYSNANWIKSNSPTMTYNSAIAPNGTLTASGLKSNDATNYKSINQTISSISPNSTFTYSIYVKKETSETFFGGLSLYFSGGTPKVFFGIVNAVNGTVTNVSGSSSITPIFQVVDSGNYWRIIATATDTGSNTSVLAEYYATLSQNGTSLSTGIGSVRTIWGAQVEQGSTATEYFPTTTRLNIPRIDYTNGSCPSLLVEPQRTNLALYSEQFDNAYWVKSAIGGTISLTPNYSNSPSGVLNADRLLVNNVSNSYVATSTITVTNATSYTMSIYAKSNTGSSYIYQLRDGYSGAVSSNLTITPNWQRFTLTFTSVGTIAEIQFRTTVVGASDISIWGAQLEASTYPTSYIPTVASTVTRNADVISKTGISSLIGQTEGTMFLDFELLPNNINAAHLFALNDGTTTNMIRSQIFILSPTVSQFRTGVVTLGADQGENFTTITQLRNKMAISYSLNNVKIFINGALISTDTSATIPTMNTFNIGNRTLDNIIGSSYKQAILFKTQLTNAECIALTTL